MQDVAVARWIDVLDADAVPEGEVKGVKIGEEHVAIYRINGKIHATSDVCTHEYALLSGGWLEEGVIECPLHGARFNIADGRCLGPFGTDLRCFKARVQQGRIEIDLTDEDAS